MKWTQRCPFLFKNKFGCLRYLSYLCFMVINKEYSLDEVYTQFTLLETIALLGTLYEAQLHILEFLDLSYNQEYDVTTLQAEKEYDLISKNIKTFQIAVMAMESKIFDKVNIKGNISLIGNN